MRPLSLLSFETHLQLPGKDKTTALPQTEAERKKDLDRKKQGPFSYMYDRLPADDQVPTPSIVSKNRQRKRRHSFSL